MGCTTSTDASTDNDQDWRDSADSSIDKQQQAQQNSRSARFDFVVPRDDARIASRRRASTVPRAPANAAASSQQDRSQLAPPSPVVVNILDPCAASSGSFDFPHREASESGSQPREVPIVTSTVDRVAAAPQRTGPAASVAALASLTKPTTSSVGRWGLETLTDTSAAAAGNPLRGSPTGSSSGSSKEQLESAAMASAAVANFRGLCTPNGNTRPRR